MYCPKCSQQQISDGVRFCSRCGFELTVVSDALQNEGRSTDNVTVEEVRRSAFVGFGLVTASALFLLATLIIGTPEPSFIVQMNLLVAVLIYLSALGYLFFKLRGPGKLRSTEAASGTPELEHAPTTRSLLKEPDPSNFVAPNKAFQESRPKEPASVTVTEDTTGLLKDD